MISVLLQEDLPFPGGDRVVAIVAEITASAFVLAGTPPLHGRYFLLCTR